MAQTTQEKNKEVVRHFFVDGHKQADIFDEVLAPDAVLYMPGLPGPIRGLEGFKQLHAVFQTAFPDLEAKIDRMIAEGDQVIAQWTISGTHKGDFQGIPPTGKRFSITATDLLRIEDGRIVEDRDILDQMLMMQQLGLAPSPGQ